MTSPKLKPLGEIATLQRGFDLPHQDRQEGQIPIISSGGRSGFHSVHKVNPPGVVTGRYGSIGEFFYIEEKFWPLNTTLWVKNFHGNCEKYVYYLLSSLNFDKFSAKTGVPGVNRNDLHKIKVPFLPIQKQKSVVQTLECWDNAIEKTEALIAAKEKQFEWLKSQLLLNNPKSKRWNTSTLGEFIVEKKEKSTTPDLYPCLTSSRRGIFLQEDYFSKQVASKDNSGYKIMSRGDFTFRSMSDDGLFVFNKQTIIDKGLISPAYGVFSPKQNMESDFLYYFLNSPAFRRALSREVQGGTRTALKLNALKKLEVKIPCIQEQKDIASKLNIAKKEIDLVKELLEKYRSQKRGLMQKLLTGEWQVTSAQVGAEGKLQDRTKENVA
ncbi:TPA: restriction endonuclease subunit S [Vibrio alginolyticus]|uniref:restriction endonuclease subunit S n=1 Tax=Vibrio alginolyticus TaxID=663 RepID=UPI00215BFEBB|nr:restriction endonuclease subunit S [Vibrio alginolyticus]ELB2848798.1 restriction endonuclease subunit S [Vibrio alginolyticus]MCR9330071.1 restriction endonuclease subunit S [Vibrio alginolyticus]MCR9357988.1 restriction endonuclease subunit S [Vibrio alginolyticus]